LLVTLDIENKGYESRPARTSEYDRNYQNSRRIYKDAGTVGKCIRRMSCAALWKPDKDSSKHRSRPSTAQKTRDMNKTAENECCGSHRADEALVLTSGKNPPTRSVVGYAAAKGRREILSLKTAIEFSDDIFPLPTSLIDHSIKRGRQSVQQ